jgi:hypothetical protein
MDLKSLKGAFACVPKFVAPDEDPGIYFQKAMYDLLDLIKKYENLASQGECLNCAFARNSWRNQKEKEEKANNDVKPRTN